MVKLTDLAKVAWNEKDIASGKAEHVLEAIMGLISSDDNIRNRSYWQLDNEVVLQGDLYEAAYHVIPFLVQMLDIRPDHGRDRIYDLLYEIANGFAPPTARCHTDEGEDIPLMDGVYRQLNIARGIFLRDASDADSEISTRAKELTELIESGQRTDQCN